MRLELSEETMRMIADKAEADIKSYSAKSALDRQAYSDCMAEQPVFQSEIKRITDGLVDCQAVRQVATQSLQIAQAALSSCAETRLTMQAELSTCAETRRITQVELSTCAETRRIAQAELSTCTDTRKTAQAELSTCTDTRKIAQAELSICTDTQQSAETRLIECQSSKNSAAGTQMLAELGTSSAYHVCRSMSGGANDCELMQGLLRQTAKWIGLGDPGMGALAQPQYPALGPA
jgi:hypothetical protein